MLCCELNKCFMGYAEVTWTVPLISHPLEFKILFTKNVVIVLAIVTT
jgi:hypothetical protein